MEGKSAAGGCNEWKVLQKKLGAVGSSRDLEREIDTIYEDLG